MSEIVKPIDKHHGIRMVNDQKNGELVVVGKGSNTYLWVGNDNVFFTFDGRENLRQLAKVLLDLTE